MRELTEKIVIEGKSIVKDFQLGDTRTRVLKSISLKVSQGEFVSIMGQSGSGKSTLQIGRASCRERVFTGV